MARARLRFFDPPEKAIQQSSALGSVPGDAAAVRLAFASIALPNEIVGWVMCTIHHIPYLNVIKFMIRKLRPIILDRNIRTWITRRMFLNHSRKIAKYFVRKHPTRSISTYVLIDCIGSYCNRSQRYLHPKAIMSIALSSKVGIEDAYEWSLVERANYMESQILAYRVAYGKQMRRFFRANRLLHWIGRKRIRLLTT